MKFILKRTSNRFIDYEETDEEELQSYLTLSIKGLSDFKNKTYIETSKAHIHYPAGEEVAEIKVPIIEIDSLEELLKVVNHEDVVITKDDYYEYPILEIYDDYRE